MFKVNVLLPVQIFFCLFLITFFSYSQSSIEEEKLDYLFSKYVEPYQEVTYAHLNKTKLLKGEMLGFTGYIFDKKEKVLSTNTKNLYYKVLDENSKVIDEKLLFAANGVAHGNLIIDKKYKKGNYTFVLFTNWMLNFSQQNIFSQSFEIIDSDFKKQASNNVSNTSLDIQLLPEGGHFLENTKNTVGVIVKNNLGYGIPNLKADIYNSDNIKISTIKLNELGIGRFTFTPKGSKKYKVVFNYNDTKEEKYFAKDIKKEGVLLKVNRSNEYCIVSLITNKETLPTINNKNYKLTLHDGKSLKSFNITIDKKLFEAKKIKFEDLATGINVFTLFDENNKPIAERLFFNYHNLNTISSHIKSITQLDSITSVNLNFNNFKEKGFNNVSVSVLPVHTKAYHKNNNIIVQTLLKPYLKGHIENANYYFKKINRETKYDLDNLLITQGWSSYDWTAIFNKQELKLKYEFENGITVKGISKKKIKKKKELLIRLGSQKPLLIELNDSINSFMLSDFFPKRNENLSIADLNKKGKLKTVSLSLDYSPKKVPETNFSSLNLSPKANNYDFKVYNYANEFSKLNNSINLDEIVIKTSLEKIRKEKIIAKAKGNVLFTSRFDRNMSLVDYINRTGRLTASVTDGELTVQNRRLTGITNQLGLANNRFGLILDGKLVFGIELTNFFMSEVEYVEIIPGWRIIDGRSFPGGSIKIKTNPEKYANEYRKKTVSTFSFPLRFASTKAFYKPKYQNYNSTFFKNYGVVDWLPINKIDENGNLNLKITNKNLKEFKIYIEGFTDNGNYIFEEKNIINNKSNSENFKGI